MCSNTPLSVQIFLQKEDELMDVFNICGKKDTEPFLLCKSKDSDQSGFNICENS